MGYAVYHVEKGKSNATAIGNHIDRREGKEHSYRQADPERKDQNVHFKGLHNGAEKKNLQTAIDDRIKEGYTGKRAIRKDAVKYLKHVNTGSHKEMTEMAKDPKKFKSWVKANIEFMKEEFGGKENIVRCSLHMDEKTPHLHFVTVPLTKDGRLSAKEILGDRKEMSARQDRYAEKMKDFGLERGIKSTGIKHENARSYYARIEQQVVRNKQTVKAKVPEMKLKGLDTKIEKPKLLENSREWEERQKKAIVGEVNKQLYTARQDIQKSIDKQVNSQIEPLKTQNTKLLEENGKLRRENNQLRGVIRGPKKQKDRAKGMGLGRTLNPFKF